jgi:hypothetical protein
MPTHIAKPGRHGGGKKCAACALPEDQREQLDGELAKHVPLLRLEKRFGISRTALRAHRGHHISPALIALRTERSLNGVRKVSDRMEDVITETDAMYQSAKRATNMPLALKANSQQRENYELLAKVTGELDERPQVVVNIMQSPEYVNARSIIFMALEPYPELRRAIAMALRQSEQWPDAGTVILGWEEIKQRLGPRAFPLEDKAS